MTVITGRENIEAVRFLALKGALRLETLGMKRRGKSARRLVNEVMGTKARTAQATLLLYEEWLRNHTCHVCTLIRTGDRIAVLTDDSGVEVPICADCALIAEETSHV